MEDIIVQRWGEVYFMELASVVSEVRKYKICITGSYDGNLKKFMWLQL